MLKINKQTITLTKGDDASLRLVPRYKDKTEYVLTEGDSAVFRIKFGHTLVELDCTLNLETNKIVANITPNDTKDFNPGIYRYEAELITSFGFHYTFIADQTFILGQEYEQRITSTSNGNSSAVGGNLPEIDGIVDGEPVVYGDIQPTNPMMDYEELNHLPKLNNITIKGSHDNAYYGIPTKTSDLENDSDFVSDDDYVHTDNNYDDTAKNAVDALGTASTYDVPESGNAGTSQVVKGDDSRLRDNRNPNPHTHSKADITDFPTNISAFNNDSGFITNTVNNLANYYLKTQTYTQTEVDNLISAAVSGRFQKVNTLPASGQPNVIYLVPKADPETSNTCDEYIWQDNAWELIGSTEVDLSDYVTDDDLTTALQSYLTTSAFNTAIASYYTKTETDNLLANKVDKVAGKGLSTNDYDNTAKGIVDGVTSALNDKVDKVQGKGLSTNDYDNTAKGIVDGVTSALADKVDKVNGKGLSTEDYTTAEKSKLGGISDNAKKVASSSTNGHIEIDDVDTTVYDDSAVQTAIDNIEDELSTDYATVEGNPLNFTTKSAQNAKSTILSVEPIQDLHGYDKPWVGGAGKNKLVLTEDDIKTISQIQWTNNSTILNGITYTILTDADNNVVGIMANNTATNTSQFTISKIDITEGRYTFSSGLSIVSNDSYYVRYVVRDSSGTAISIDDSVFIDVYTTEIIKTIPSNASYINAYIGVVSGKTANNIIFKPMVRLSTVTDSTFEPYTNICPISGRTEIGILGCGKNLATTKIYKQDYVIASNGSESASAGYCITDKIFIENTKDYYLTFTKQTPSDTDPLRVGCYDKNGEFLERKGYVTSNSKITFSEQTSFIRLSYANNSSLPTYTYIQLEENSATEYTPYTKSNDLTISLGQTVYGGTLDVENGVLVVDGTITDARNMTSITSIEQRTNTTKFWLYPLTSPTSIEKRNQSLCSIAPYNDSILNNDLFGFYIITSYLESVCVSLPKDLVGTTQQSISDYITNNPFCFYTKLATPITINLTPHTIKLLEGVNNISVDDANATITLTYRDGSVATLGDLTSAVDSLDGKIDESKILTDTVTGDKYILVVTNGVLSVEQISN